MPRQWKERRATPGAWQFMQGRWHKADAAGVWRVSAAEPRVDRLSISGINISQHDRH